MQPRVVVGQQTGGVLLVAAASFEHQVSSFPGSRKKACRWPRRYRRPRAPAGGRMPDEQVIAQTDFRGPEGALDGIVVDNYVRPWPGSRHFLAYSRDRQIRVRDGLTQIARRGAVRSGRGTGPASVLSIGFALACGSSRVARGSVLALSLPLDAVKFGDVLSSGSAWCSSDLMASST